jgi:hypothetical protein
LSDTLCLCLALLKGMFILKLGPHGLSDTRI